MKKILSFFIRFLLLLFLVFASYLLFFGFSTPLSFFEECQDITVIDKKEDLEEYRDPLTGLVFVRLPESCSLIGNSEYKEKGMSDEGPQISVYTKSFYMGKTLVTRKAFARFIADSEYLSDAEKNGFSWLYTGRGWEALSSYSWRNPGFAQEDEDPVVHVSLRDARAMAKWMSRGKMLFRLPTELEWEYAARGGEEGPFLWLEDSELPFYANIADLSAAEYFSAWKVSSFEDGFIFSSPVGSFKPNGYGLYDVLGNVWEWCDTAYDPLAYKKKIFRRPKDKDPVVIRGTSWYTRPEEVRFTKREFMGNGRRSGQDLGFRLLMEKKD